MIIDSQTVITDSYKKIILKSENLSQLSYLNVVKFLENVIHGGKKSKVPVTIFMKMLVMQLNQALIKLKIRLITISSKNTNDHFNIYL
jgi:hypothetical protein